jgi:hypothetical protein
MGPAILPALTAHQDTNFSVDGAAFRGLDVDPVNSSSDYFACLCIPASEPTLHQKRMSTADRSHLRRHTAETNSKNKPCYLDRVATRSGLLLFIGSTLQ